MKVQDDFANARLCQENCMCNFNGTNEEAIAYNIKNFTQTEGVNKIQDCPSFI